MYPTKFEYAPYFVFYKFFCSMYVNTLKIGLKFSKANLKPLKAEK